MRLTAGWFKSLTLPTGGASCAGTMSTSVFAAKSRRVSASRSFCSRPRAIVSWSALAKTSTGAPWEICWISTPEAAKLKRTVLPGLPASKRWPISLKASVRLAAAETVSCCAPTRAGKAKPATIRQWRKKRDERCMDASVGQVDQRKLKNRFEATRITIDSTDVITTSSSA